MGEERSLFTSGVLVGSGGRRGDGVDAFWALLDLHDARGDIQGLIITSSLGKAGTAMENHHGTPLEELT